MTADSDLRAVLAARLGDAYTIEREIDGGAMSRVFVATETALSRRVVLKVIHGRDGATVDDARFTREIQIAAALHHPHIVPVLSAGRVGGVSYFTMPFVEGESLRARLGRGPLPIADAVSICRDVCRGLAYAHGRGIVHRDIKPDNILLSAHSAALTDFGVATALDASLDGAADYSPVPVIGTPVYMAPEQATTNGIVDARSDLYALGVTVYEMIAGVPPFSRGSPQDVLVAHVTEAPDPVDHLRESVPPALSALVMHLLAKAPADRPQTAEEVLRELAVIDAPAVSVGNAPRSRWNPLRPAGILAVAAVTLVMVFIGARSWNRDSAPRAHSQRVQRLQRIAVLPFVNSTADPAFDDVRTTVATAITTNLTQLDSVAVLPAPDNERGTTGSRVSAESMRKIGAALGASSVVWGAITRSADALTVRAEVIDVADGRVSAVIGPLVLDPAHPASTVDELAERIASAVDARRLALRIGPIGPPPTRAAYREFLLGLEHRWWNRHAAAYANFRAATLIDTTFTVAQYYAVRSLVDIGPVVRTFGAPNGWVADSIIDRMKARQAHMSTYELDLLDNLIAYAHSNFTAQQIAIRRLLARDSSLRSVNELALASLAANHAREAIAVMESWPREFYHPNDDDGFGDAFPDWEAEAYHMLGEFRDVLRVSDAGLRLMPRRSTLVAQKTDAFAALGDLASLQHLVDSAEAAWPPVGANALGPATRYMRAALELRFHGFEEPARMYASKGLDWLAARPDSQRAGQGWQLLHSKFLIFAGRDADARRELAGIVLRSPPRFVKLEDYAGPGVTRAVAEAHGGDRGIAMAMLATLDTLASAPYDFGRARFAQARILAALGDFAAAVDRLRTAFREGMPMDVGIHRNLAFGGMRAYAPFLALLAPKI